MQITKSKLAIILSKLEQCKHQNIGLEQYQLPSERAAELLWGAYMKNELKGKKIADLGCGNGILGLGALLLGAKKAWFLEISESSMEICRKNLEKINEELIDESGKSLILGESEFLLQNVEDFDEKVDVVLQNPPFGTKEKHADKMFLEKAFNCADVVYSIHKSSTRKFLEKFSAANRFKITEEKKFLFPLKKTRTYHVKKYYDVEVACYRFEKIG